MGCERCSDRRHVRDEETGLWGVCDCLKKARLAKQFQQAGIPKEFWGLTEGHLPQAAWATRVKGVLADLLRTLEVGKAPLSLVVVGGSDRNRSLVASLVMRYFLKQGKTARVVPVAQVFEVMFGTNAEIKSLNDLLRGDCLCLELGFEITNPKTGTVVISIWRERKRRGHYTFLTVAESQDKVRERYGKELYDLLTDKSYFHWLQVGTER